MVFRAVVFTFIPTAVELILVCGLLSRTFTPLVSLMVLGTFVAYTLWTAALTRAAAEVRLQLNATDDVVITVPANAAARALKGWLFVISLVQNLTQVLHVLTSAFARN